MKIIACLLLSFCLLSCGNKPNKKAAPPVSKTEEVADFVSAFKLIDGVFNFPKSELASYTNDSGIIDQSVFKTKVPDSLLHINIDENVKKIYAIGKMTKAGTTFYIVKLKNINNNQLVILAFNNKQQCEAALTLLDDAKAKKLSETVEIDAKFNFNKLLSKKVGNTVVEGKEMYAYDDKLHQFVLVMKDNLGDEEPDFINPIDTLPRTNKFAADYIQNNNILSVRDSKKKGYVEFILNINDKETGCKGELRGEGVIKSENIFEYNKPGDPCILQFELNRNNISLIEVKGCGSRLGDLKCSFNGTFKKKKQVQKEIPRKKRKS